MGRSEFQLLELLLHFCSVLILWSMTAYSSIPAVAASSAKPGCQSQCGHVAIPYPFGIGEEGCYLTPGPESNAVRNYGIHYDAFKILCNDSTSPPKPFLNLNGTFLELLEISIDEGTIKVNGPITFSNCTNKQSNRKPPRLSSTPFWYSYKKNRFTSVGCGGLALMTYRFDNGSAITMGGCLSICEESIPNILVRNNSCGGINCCQTTLPVPLARIEANFQTVETFGSKSTCKYAFIVDQRWFTLNSTNISGIGDFEFAPVVLELSMWLFTEIDIYGTEDWTDGHNSSYIKQDDDDESLTGGRRFCSKGFQGNAYLLHGCKDINECEQNRNICDSKSICINLPGTFRCQLLVDPISPHQPVKLGVTVTGTVLGVLSILIGGWWLHKVVKKRRSTKRKQKFYKQNGGLLLEQQLSSGEVNVQKIKLFNSEELDKPTDHYNVDRILGQGGQGTVYKGMLANGRIVAVKKSKISDGGDKEVRQFINEIVILSQIIHRNVVKLLGCCLETEVPLLVYEFVANGTLFEYIHQQSEDFPLTWETRLRVAIEVAGALSYLHSAAALPIYHRDIKSSNILLDEKYRAKVADFGTSRSISIDQTHVTTLVHGTFGYLDPEYFRSSQFTDKSDVYSFGVVLTELLTGQKPVSLTRSQEGRSLVNYFLLYMEQNRLFEILDPRVKDCRKEEIMAVASIAERCLHLNGRKRPTMKEIAGELGGIHFSSKASYNQGDQNLVEVANARTYETTAALDLITISTGPSSDDASSLFDAQPLLTSKTV